MDGWGGEGGVVDRLWWIKLSNDIRDSDLTCAYQARKQSGQYYDKCEQNPFADGCESK